MENIFQKKREKFSYFEGENFWENLEILRLI